MKASRKDSLGLLKRETKWLFDNPFYCGFCNSICTMKKVVDKGVSIVIYISNIWCPNCKCDPIQKKVDMELARDMGIDEYFGVNT